MSHFSVLVTARDEAELYERMIPYYEYGCNREDDAELKRRGTLEFCSVEEEYRKEYEEDSVEMAKMPDGRFLFKWDDEFRVPRTFGTGSGTHKVPDDIEMVRVPHKDRYPTFAEFIEGWAGYNYDEGQGTWGYWHNPNDKWDWYMVGGRFTGKLKLKPASRLLLRGNTEVAGLNRNEVDFLVRLYLENHGKFEKVVAKYEGRGDEIRNAVEQIANGPNEQVFVRPEGAENGRPGILTAPNTDMEKADTAFVKDVDWAAIAMEQLQRHMKTYLTYQKYLNALRASDWSNRHEDVWQRAKRTWEGGDQRSEYCQEAFATLEDYALDLMVDRELSNKENIHLFNTFQEAADMFYKSEEEYRAMFVGEAPVYAFVDRDGKWNQRGEMGWWGMSDDTRGTDNYDEAFWMFVEGLSGDERVWVVDCHI